MYASPSQYDHHAWLCVLITESIHSVKNGVCVFFYILHIDQSTLLVMYEHFWVVWTSWLVLKTSKGLFKGSDLVLRLVILWLRLDV